MYIHKISENICVHKRLYINVRSNIIHDSQKVEPIPDVHQPMNE